MNATVKLNNLQKHMIENEGFYFAKVTMFRQDSMTGSKSNIVETYEGYIQETSCGIIYMIREKANMRSHNKKEILTVSQRLISVEKVGA